MKIERHCKLCGERFFTIPSRIKKNGGKFCSQKCYWVWLSKNKIGVNSPGWKGGKIERKCRVCGKKFLKNPSIIKIGSGKFCSRKCLGVWKSKNESGKNSPLWKGGEVKMICKICNKEFFVKPYLIKKGGGKFCSYRCLFKWQRGEKNPKWKGGITPIRNLIRSSSFYKRWRQSCFIRDNFTCQKCGQVGGNVQVHHKKSFAGLLQEAKNFMPLLPLYEAAMLYTPLWDINNGITLCEKCHDKKEGKNGL